MKQQEFIPTSGAPRKRKRLKQQHRNHKIMTLQDTSRKKTRMYLSIADRGVIADVCGPKAAILHGIYVDMAEETSSELTDAYIANELNWSVRAVARQRLALEKNGWFKKITIEGANKMFRASFYLLDQETVESGMTDEEYAEYEGQLADKSPDLSLV